MIKKKNDSDALVTKGILMETLGEFSDAILQGVERMFKNYPTKDEVREGFKQLEKKMDSRFDKVESDIHWLKDDVKGIKEEMSLFATKKEVNELRKKVDVLASN